MPRYRIVFAAFLRSSALNPEDREDHSSRFAVMTAVLTRSASCRIRQHPHDFSIPMLKSHGHIQVFHK
jgi:hypothetical protein